MGARRAALHVEGKLEGAEPAGQHFAEAFSSLAKRFFRRRVTLGGNTDDGSEHEHSAYLAVLRATPLAAPGKVAAAADVLAEETDLALTLAQVDGPRLVLPKTQIVKRESLNVSPMPTFAALLAHSRWRRSRRI